MKSKTTCAVVSGNKNETRLEIAAKIEKLVENGVTDFLCDCERGFPLTVAEVVIGLRDARKSQGLNTPRLCVVAPHEEQTTDWDEDSRDRYYAVHEQADEVLFLQAHFSDGCHERCEQYMIDNSDFVLREEAFAGAAGG